WPLLVAVLYRRRGLSLGCSQRCHPKHRDVSPLHIVCSKRHRDQRFFLWRNDDIGRIN
ncbi:hypothetical protein S83_005033, partial [Arachis hypogaea]